MRAIGFMRAGLETSEDSNIAFGEVRAECLIEEVDDPKFDAISDRYGSGVLVKIDAFSCNYRDIGVVSALLSGGKPNLFVLFGSEFSGTVLEVGKKVTDFSPGDRVVGDNSYPVARTEPNYPGVPANHVSCEYLVLPCSKLFKIPETIPVEIAASFSLNGQTAYSVVRRLAAGPHDPVLITAGRSNVSLMLLGALARRGVPTVVMTTCAGVEQQFEDMGADEVIVLERTGSRGGIAINGEETSRLTGKFYGIFDPYFDVYLYHVIPFLRHWGRYLSCGAAQQAIRIPEISFQDGTSVLGKVMEYAVMSNLSISGNCLGIPEDLANCVDDINRDHGLVKIDSVFYPGQELEFVRRAFFDKHRFGKVVYCFNCVDRRPDPDSRLQTGNHNQKTGNRS